jgi:hypothetical protein
MFVLPLQTRLEPGTILTQGVTYCDPSDFLKVSLASKIASVLYSPLLTPSPVFDAITAVAGTIKKNMSARSINPVRILFLLIVFTVKAYVSVFLIREDTGFVRMARLFF